MSDVSTLHISAWVAERLPETLLLTRFRVPVAMHDTLVQWCREKTNRQELPASVILSGLSEILGFFVPETAYMKLENDGTGEGGARLSLYYLHDRSADVELRTRIRTGINVWLGILYPVKAPEMRGAVAESALDDANWRLIEVPTGLAQHRGACALPADPTLFDALTAHAVDRLAGATLQYRSGITRTLVPHTPLSSPFNGIELVAFPPRVDRGGGTGIWSEVVTVSAANYPERPGLHLIAKPSIRNWGSIRRYDLDTDPSRSLDVFIPSADGNGDNTAYRHMSFAFRPKQVGENGERRVEAVWDCDREQRAFDLLRRLVGGGRLAGADLLNPVRGEEGMWVLPRLAPGNGDRNLAGGSGFAWPDREDMAVSLDAPLEAAGFVRAATMARLKGQMPVKGPFMKSDVSVPTRMKDAPDEEKKAWKDGEFARKEALRFSELRRVLRCTLDAVGNTDGALDLLIFAQRNGTKDLVRAHIATLLGTPDTDDGNSMRWADGLTLNIAVAPPGPLAEQLPYVDLTDDEKERLNQKQQIEVRKAKQKEAHEDAARQMAARIRGVRNGRTGVACAILEMHESLKERPRRDPFAMARRELAKQGCLPQVVLISDEVADEKYLASLKDWFRMLGVLPVFDDRLPMAPAAMTVIQRNEDMVGGGTQKAHAFPLAARVREGILECAIPEENGEPTWMPYAKAALRILSGDYGKFARNRQEENQAKFAAFFSAVLEQIDRHGAALVMAEMDQIAHRLPALQNGKLVFDELPIGNRIYRPADLPNTRVVRTLTEPRKLPSYYHGVDNKWPSGLFTWPGAERTAYGLKIKPPTVSVKSSFASMISRHLEPGSNNAADDVPRVSAQLDEMCVAFKQPADEAVEMLRMTHKLRNAHAQYDYGTRKPFPLHELRLLGGAVTFS
ncbi:RNaseH domain-containing protein [Azospirillum argentinense]|uniref:RNaseH domain-containing protein n=1 Tax=Azospirillum argentinense TaxID=2970906 RepID=A0ABW8VE64_9PROT